MKRSEKLIEELRQDVKVPDKVWMQYTNVLQGLPEKRKTERTGRRKVSRMTILAAVLMIALVGTAAAAAIIRHNNGLNLTMHIEDAELERLFNSGLLSYPADQEEENAICSVTDHDITISVDAALADSHSAIIAFTISGITLEDEDGRILTSGLEVTLDGTEVSSFEGRFYDGWYSDSQGYLMDEEGIRRIDLKGDTKWTTITAAQNGSYTYLLTILPDEDRESILGKELSVSFHNLAYFSPSASETKGGEDRWTGEWTLNWTLKGSSEQILSYPETSLGDSGAVVMELDITPLSITAVLDLPQKQETFTIVNKDGEAEEQTYYQEPPQIAGVKLKDGTLLYGICNPSTLSESTFQDGQNWVKEAQYDSEEGTLWTELYGTSYVLELSEVEAVLFWKEGTEPGMEVTEESFYQVQVK